ncbi:two pore domain potassium channel family protein [Nocardioides anomalus]|uniref:Two pore domain potassium channel family protein n=1 Tax=Nocardioides anomalus TaxID=2712223 RepID=A0A6G6WCJ1_9ACTN|nr:two pore domain potassium channel family protein [Nocardioides anomalus]QIG42962.1 two pore domain potassium channel family protein [Nocardioides anomalus]
MNRALHSLRGHPSGVLLGGQLLVVLAFPFLDHSTGGRAVIGVVQMVLVFTAVAAVRLTPALSWVALLLGLPAMVFAVLEAIEPDTDWITLTSALVHAPFYFYVSYAMIRYLFHDEKVTRDELFATGAAFTVVAWAFAYVYAAAQVVWGPGTFVSDDGDHQPWFNLLFLSFTNLTSVGLSDVLPIDPHARAFVMVEQIVGVLYVALVIARLVGLTVARASARSDGDG